MFNHLIKLANLLDSHKQYHAASQVDKLIIKLSQLSLTPKQLTPAEELAKVNRKLTPEEQAIVDKDQAEKAKSLQAKQEDTTAEQAHQAVIDRLKQKTHA